MRGILAFAAAAASLASGCFILLGAGLRYLPGPLRASPGKALAPTARLRQRVQPRCDVTRSPAASMPPSQDFSRGVRAAGRCPSARLPSGPPCRGGRSPAARQLLAVIAAHAEIARRSISSSAAARPRRASCPTGPAGFLPAASSPQKSAGGPGRPAAARHRPNRSHPKPGRARERCVKRQLAPADASREPHHETREPNSIASIGERLVEQVDLAAAIAKRLVDQVDLAAATAERLVDQVALAASPVRRAPSPVRRAPRPVKRAASPVKRAASPVAADAASANAQVQAGFQIGGEYATDLSAGRLAVPNK